jgi:uncharacterized protein (TIGR02246 family)
MLNRNAPKQPILLGESLTIYAENMRKPEDVLDRWTGAWNRRDAEALANLFVEDAEFVNVVGLWWHDRSAIRAAHQYGFDYMFSRSHMRFTHVQKRLIGEAGAVVVAKWELEGQTGPDGEPAGNRAGIFTFVLEFDAASCEWIAVSAQNTDIVEGVQSNISVEKELRPAYYGKSPSVDSPSSGAPGGEDGENDENGENGESGKNGENAGRDHSAKRN